MDLFIIIVESICVVAFSISGAIVAINKKMDIFGVAILGLITSIGGGVIRDLVLDVTPPLSMQNPRIAIIALITAIIFFFKPIRKKIQEEEKINNILMFITDSVGLGLFTVIGIQSVINHGYIDNHFFQIFVGVIAGVGGGVMRDVLAGDRPYIFIKHFYACASLIGAIICSYSWNLLGSTYAMLLSAIVIFIIRVLAAKYHWSLPVAKE